MQLDPSTLLLDAKIHRDRIWDAFTATERNDPRRDLLLAAFRRAENEVKAVRRDVLYFRRNPETV